MADKAVIIGREAAARGLPSDLPTELPKYPGKALAHRYVPTQQPRLVVEPGQADRTKLTSSIPFKPLVSFSHPDKNVYLGPVRNVHPRGLQPVAIEGAVNLPGPEGQSIEVSEDLRGPLEARVNRLTTLTQPPVVPPELIEPPTLAATDRGSAIVATPTSLTELEKVKSAAIEELAKREAQTPFIKETAPAAAQGPPLTETRPSDGLEAPVEIKPVTETAVSGLEKAEKPEDKTGKLLSEAERLESELSETLKQITSQAVGLKTGEVGKEKENEYLAQISQLVADRTHLQKQANDMAAELKTAEGKQKEAEKELEEQTGEFNRQTQELRIEKTNLSNQVKNLGGKINELQKAQEIVKEVGGQVAELKTQIETVEKDRDSAREQVKKLQTLLLELQKAPVATPPELKKIVEPTTPKATEQPKVERPKVRIVKPQTAVGKMAPTLTSAPNVINGIVKDAAGYLLSGVIIVVKDSAGEPVRALKTNKIGQFAISTPLPNGVYNMELEVESHNFDIVQVELDGKVLAPLEIRANN